MYIDLQGVEHKLPHNTNATQLYLIAHLPGGCYLCAGLCAGPCMNLCAPLAALL